MRFLIILASVLWISTVVQAQETCTALYGRGYAQTADSILIDTCHSTNTHPVFWVKRGYRIWFDSDAIKLSWAPADTDLEVDWRHIDTAFPTLRSVFADFDSTVAHILFKKLAPAATASASRDCRSATYEDAASHVHLCFMNYRLLERNAENFSQKVQSKIHEQ